jgi:hypothetical protein
MKKILIILLSASLFSLSAQAQGSDMSSVRRNIATIIFCGIGGAVLGLSTLSFYGAPQEHVSNITGGFALGLIGGTAYVTGMSMKESVSKYDWPQTIPSNPHQVIAQSSPLWRMSWDF